MRPCPGLLPVLLAAAAACHRSNSSAPQLGEATIGPEGGVLAIDSGVQAGLRLTVPPGALAKPTRIVVRDATPPPPPGGVAQVMARPPAWPFSFEPANLRLDELATLRMPYSTAYVVRTAPGNVRARETRNGFEIDYEPGVVDVQGGFLEVPLRHLSQYQVVTGPVAENIAAYWQTPGVPVSLTGDVTFVIEEVPSMSPFASPGAMRWSITAPGPVTQQAIDLLYFDGDRLLRGRESLEEDWRETWTQGYFPFAQAEMELPIGVVTMATQVRRPISGPPTAGQITVFGLWSWSAPRRLPNDTWLYDVARLHLELAWNRIDLGVGQRQYDFWFAPGIGLLAFAQDGVVHERLTPP